MSREKRYCERCKAKELSRYNPGPYCYACQAVVDEESLREGKVNSSAARLLRSVGRKMKPREEEECQSA